MPDFSQMTTEEFEQWKKDSTPGFAGVKMPPLQPSPSPTPAPPQDYGQTASVWLNGDPGQDHTLPSGRVCRLRALPIEKLAAQGILDRLTRLQGITQILISKSEGQPPAKAGSETKAISELLEVLNILLPMVVVEPKVWAIPPDNADGSPGERKADRIYPESIPFTDRVAILNQATAGVVEFDSFRQ